MTSSSSLSSSLLSLCHVHRSSSSSSMFVYYCCVITVLSLVVVANTIPYVHAIPMKVNIRRGNQECLYESLQEEERVTISAFILSGSKLQATMTLDGPIVVGSPDVDVPPKTLLSASQSFQPSSDDNALTISQLVDWESLELPPILDDEEENNNNDNEVDEDEAELDSSDPEYKEKLKERRQRHRSKLMARREKQEQQRLAQQQKTREEGTPIELTAHAPASGWYRMCLEPVEDEIIAEMDMRKESELGGIDEQGHVITYEVRAMKEEDAELDKDTASQEGIKDEDFDDTKHKLKEMRRVLNQVQNLQQNERRRVSVQAETNEHTHSKMVLSSVIETIFFMAITGYQVYTIRKWFTGAPALGR